MHPGCVVMLDNVHVQLVAQLLLTQDARHKVSADVLHTMRMADRNHFQGCQAKSGALLLMIYIKWQARVVAFQGQMSNGRGAYLLKTLNVCDQFDMDQVEASSVAAERIAGNTSAALSSSNCH